MKRDDLKKINEVGKNNGKKFIQEFKDFALRGNVIDLAVGVLIGGAFQTIVTSFTKNIISPILGCLSEVDFSQFELNIGKLKLTYGAFITDIINFMIMALVVFLLVKAMNKLASLGAEEKKTEEAEKTTKTCPHCYSEINLKADRCPHCTSELEVEKVGK